MKSFIDLLHLLLDTIICYLQRYIDKIPHIFWISLLIFCVANSFGKYKILIN